MCIDESILLILCAIEKDTCIDMYEYTVFDTDISLIYRGVASHMERFVNDYGGTENIRRIVWLPYIRT